MSEPARSLYSVPGPDTARDGVGDAGWELPLPLSAAQSLPPFPVAALPGWVADQVAAVAEATQTPPDLAGCVALAALSTAAGGRAVVQVRPGWVEPVNLYTVVVMEPSARKSPVFTAMVRPIYALEKALREEAKESIEAARVRRRAAEAASERAEKTAATLDKIADDKDRDAAIADAVEAALSAAAIDIPVEPKLVVDDITPEKVGTVLAEQGGRLAVLSDEGGIFAIIAGRYSGSSNTNVFLKGYTGTQLRVDRTNRPSELVEHPALTLGLTIQPAVIDDLGNTAMLRGSGFLARILYSQPVSLVGHRKARPHPVPDHVADAYNSRLHTIAHTLHGWAEDPARFVFAEHADDLMAELQDDLETRLNPHGGAWAHIGDWGGKAAGQTARLAGLLHTAIHPDNPWEHEITGDTFTHAWELIDYYGAHALHVFDQIGADTDLDTARRLQDWLTRTGPARFSKRDAFKAVRNTTVQKVNDLDTALELLTDHGHIHPQPQPERPKGQRGRAPSPTYWTHPTYRRAGGTEQGEGTR
ncbi:YfjI family protein [Actinophytocola sp.]|uniref:YfjI family protein n=1 Tax=Actinophytocola sp. TaxID=1872138 RepID=UPI002D2917E8|nr:YfjI family protein [Actinophytocola sp.]HYQ66152.1 YfjI family protein [Actinophytocola sp.]